MEGFNSDSLQAAGHVVGGLFAGFIAAIGAAFGIKNKAVQGVDKHAGEIRKLEDAVLGLQKDFQSVTSSLSEHSRNIDEIDDTMKEIFRELKAISISLQDVSTKVEMSMKGRK